MAKGGASENETCRELSLWWTYGESRAMFRRTQMSGGKATVRSKKKKKTPYEYGDITFSEPEGKPLIDFLLIENKTGYKDTVNVLDFIDSPKKHPQLLKWWWKCEKEREEAGRWYSILVFRRTRKSKCVMISTELFTLFEDWCGEFTQTTIDLFYTAGVLKSNELLGQWTVVRLNDLLGWITPETITAILKDTERKEWGTTP
jgi:hypothetical protein